MLELPEAIDPSYLFFSFSSLFFLNEMCPRCCSVLPLSRCPVHLGIYLPSTARSLSCNLLPIVRWGWTPDASHNHCDNDGVVGEEEEEEEEEIKYRRDWIADPGACALVRWAFDPQRVFPPPCCCCCFCYSSLLAGRLRGVIFLG